MDPTPPQILPAAIVGVGMGMEMLSHLLVRRRRKIHPLRQHLQINRTTGRLLTYKTTTLRNKYRRIQKRLDQLKVAQEELRKEMEELRSQSQQEESPESVDPWEGMN